MSKTFFFLPLAFIETLNQKKLETWNKFKLVVDI